jgi:hypothetical protein
MRRETALKGLVMNGGGDFLKIGKRGEIKKRQTVGRRERRGRRSELG